MNQVTQRQTKIRQSVLIDEDLAVFRFGYIDLEEKTLQPLNNPFGPKV